MTTHHTDEKKPARGGLLSKSVDRGLVAVIRTVLTVMVAAISVCASGVGQGGSGRKQGKREDDSFHWCLL